MGITLAVNGRIQLRISKSIATSIETLKTWLDSQKNAGTPLMVVYPLANPLVIHHTPIILSSDNPGTDVGFWLGCLVPADFWVRFYRIV